MSTFLNPRLELWERARDDYLRGDAAAAVCERYGVSRSQLYVQARAGGWRRSDTFAGPEPDAAPFDDTGPAPCPVAMARLAWRRAAHAVQGGRLHEARGWTRLAADLRALAVVETGAQGWLSAQLKADAAEATRAAADPASTPDPVAPVRAVGPGPAAPDRTAVPAESGHAKPCSARDRAPEPDTPDSPVSDAESGWDDHRRLLESEDAADWRATCRRMMAERPGKPFWAEQLAAWTPPGGGTAHDKGPGEAIPGPSGRSGDGRAAGPT